jgi:formylglycine-generating enzyme required for sulfatase activity
VTTRSGQALTVDELLQERLTVDNEQVMAKNFIGSFEGVFLGFKADGKPRKGKLKLSFKGFRENLVAHPDVVGMVDGLVVGEFRMEFDPPLEGQAVIEPEVGYALFGIPNGFQCLIQFRLSPNAEQAYCMYGILTPHRLSGELMKVAEDGRASPAGLWTTEPARDQAGKEKPADQNQPAAKNEEAAVTSSKVARDHHAEAITTLYDPRATKETYLAALELLKKAKELDPGNCDIPIDTARILMKLERNAETVNILEKTIQQAPELAEPRSLLAKAYRLTGDVPKAEKACTDGLKKFPHSQELIAAYVGILESKSDWKGIEALISHYLDTAQMPPPERMRCVWVLGRTLLKAGDYEGARKRFQSIVDEAPGTPMAERAKRDLEEVGRRGEKEREQAAIIELCRTNGRRFPYDGSLLIPWAKLNKEAGGQAGPDAARPWPLWEGATSVAQYARGAGLEPTRVLDLGHGVELEAVLIPAGEFTMGVREEKGVRAHEVTIAKPFYLGRHEVTQAQYQQIMAVNPSYSKGPDLPVEMVSWDDAQEFCKKASEKAGMTVRLPTESEWEYACRAGTKTVYHSGDAEADLGRAGWYEKNSGGKTHPVGQKTTNAWGLYDMHGNVWEWCATTYLPEAAPGRQEPETAIRALRGGCFQSGGEGCSSCMGGGDLPNTRHGNKGFRIVVALSEKR